MAMVTEKVSFKIEGVEVIGKSLRKAVEIIVSELQVFKHEIDEFFGFAGFQLVDGSIILIEPGKFGFISKVEIITNYPEEEV